MRSNTIAMLARALALLAALAASPAGAAVNVSMSLSTPGGPLCTGMTSGLTTCVLNGAPGTQVTVTWSLSAAKVLYGYDFNIGWDPSELTLVAASQLFPSSSPPNTIPFVIAPNPGDPEGSAAVALSLVPYSTTALFSATFERATPLPADCQPDLWWSANGAGLSPPSLVLSNPDGAAIDVGIETLCSDGLDNDGDGTIDFDGGACAGVSPPAAPDPQCATVAANPHETASSCGLLGEAAFLLPLLAAARRWRRQP